MGNAQVDLYLSNDANRTLDWCIGSLPPVLHSSRPAPLSPGRRRGRPLTASISWGPVDQTNTVAYLREDNNTRWSVAWRGERPDLVVTSVMPPPARCRGRTSP